MIQLIVIRPAVCLRSLSFLGSTLVLAFPIAPFVSKVGGGLNHLIIFSCLLPSADYFFQNQLSIPGIP